MEEKNQDTFKRKLFNRTNRKMYNLNNCERKERKKFPCTKIETM